MSARRGLNDTNRDTITTAQASRDGLGERGTLAHLIFGAPRKSDLFGRLFRKC